MPGRGDRGGKKQKPKDAKGTLLRILKYLSSYLAVVIVLLICAFASNIGNLLGPQFAGEAIGEVEAGAGNINFERVFYYCKLMLIAYVGGNILSFLVSQGMMRVSRRVARRMRKDIFDKLMTLPVQYFDRNQAGDIISRVSYDVDVVSTSLNGGGIVYHDVHHLAASRDLYAHHHTHLHRVHPLHGQAHPASLLQAQCRIRHHERLCRGDVLWPEDHPGLCL